MPSGQTENHFPTANAPFHLFSLVLRVLEWMGVWGRKRFGVDGGLGKKGVRERVVA